MAFSQFSDFFRKKLGPGFMPSTEMFGMDDDKPSGALRGLFQQDGSEGKSPSMRVKPRMPEPRDPSLDKLEPIAPFEGAFDPRKHIEKAPYFPRGDGGSQAEYAMDVYKPRSEWANPNYELFKPLTSMSRNGGPSTLTGSVPTKADTVDGRANVQANQPPSSANSEDSGMATRSRYANVPEGLAGLNFSVDPNRHTVSAPELRSNGKMKMSKVDNMPFNPVDYSNDPEGRDRRDYFVRDQLEGKGWKSFLKTIAAGALTGLASASRDPNVGGWDILASAGAGAATAGIAKKISPEAGSAIAYETFRGPAFRALHERERLEKERQFQEAKRRNEIDYGSARTETERRRGANIDSQIESRGQADGRHKQESIARQRLDGAREIAIKRGTPHETDIIHNGEVMRVSVWPDGNMQILGRSPQPTYERGRIASRERIATGRNATSRANNAATNQSREGIAANKLQSRPASKRPFPSSQLKALAEKWGVDEAEAKRRLEVSGYGVINQ